MWSGLAAEGATLVVTLDCGATAHEALAAAAKSGLAVIVADHHLTGIFPEARWPALLEEAGFETKALTITVWDETEEPIPTFIAIKP